MSELKEEEIDEVTGEGEGTGEGEEGDEADEKKININYIKYPFLVIFW